MNKKQNIIVSKSVINQYIVICHKSSFKCNSFSEVEDKIIRAVKLGKVVVRTEDALEIGYHNLSFVVKDNVVVNMWKNNNNTKYIFVDELKKLKYDRNVLKIVI